MKVTVEVGGIDELTQGLIDLAKDTGYVLGKSVELQAHEVKWRAIGLAPEASGALRRSGTVEMIDEHTAMVSFGGPDAPYAVVIHEHPDFDPPTWEGKEIIFRPHGTGRKFLENATTERQKVFIEEIQAELVKLWRRFGSPDKASGPRFASG